MHVQRKISNPKSRAAARRFARSDSANSKVRCRIPGNGFETASILSSFGAQPRTGAAVKFIKIDGLNAGFKRIALSRLVSQLPSTSACYWTGYATSHFAAWSPLTGSVEIQKFNRGALGVVLVVLV